MSQYKVFQGQTWLTIASLFIAGLLVLIPFRTGKSKPAQGDWIVIDTQVVENQSITLQGHLIVKDGGNLTLRNVILMLGSQYDGQYRIEVEPGGALFINDSQISATNPEQHFAFSVSGASFEMRSSELHHVGWGPGNENLDRNALQNGQLGLYIGMVGAVLDGNTISENYIGVIDTGKGTRLTNNTISANTVHAIYVENGTDGAIINNNIQHGGDASSLIRMRPGHNYKIADNTLNQQLHRGVIETLNSDGNRIQNNHISGLGIGIVLMFVSNNNIVLENTIDTDEAGIMIFGRGNQVLDNTIYDDNFDYHTGIYLVYAYNTIVARNTIINCGGENGIMVRYSSNNAIFNNTAKAKTIDAGRPTTGLVLFHKSHDNVVQGNRFSGFHRGLGLYYSSDDNVINGNQFSSTPHQEAIIDEASGNLITGNNFLGIGTPPYDDGDNQWDEGGRGNYWAAYAGSDADGDGVGDESYWIGPSGVDHHPLVTPLSIPQVTTPTLEIAPMPDLPNLVGMNVTGSQVIENQTVNLNWIDVADGGDLTLRNVTLVAGGDPNSTSSLQVKAGGRLVIEDSTLKHLDNGTGFIMKAHIGSSFQMRNSELDGCGQEWWSGGLQILTGDFLLENNLISNTMLHFGGVSGGMLINNTIKKSYQALGFNNSHTLIQGNDFSHSIRSPLQGFGSYTTIRNNQFHDSWSNGINLWGGSGNLVEGNTFWNIPAGYTGLRISGNENTILDNTVNDAGTGLRIGYAGDQVTMRAERNHVSNCDTCIEIRSQNGNVKDNYASNCTLGLLLEGKNNNLSGNTFNENGTGVTIGFGYHSNVIHDNLFMYNVLQAEDNGHLNQWDDGARGNYWSDYAGTDSNGDGIGDTPYTVPPSGVDRFPLILEFSWHLFLPLLLQ